MISQEAKSFILDIVLSVDPEEKQEGEDFSLEELFAIVSELSLAHERRIRVARSSFYRAIRKFSHKDVDKVGKNDRGYYTKEDVAVLVTWFTRDRQKVPTYESFPPYANDVMRRYRQQSA